MDSVNDFSPLFYLKNEELITDHYYSFLVIYNNVEVLRFEISVNNAKTTYLLEK